jgi:aspartyl-tRNA(Asn)/glutamyl-tRNA(Gln) amidotransferase subunit A
MTPPESARIAAARRRIRDLAHLNAFLSISNEVGAGPIVAVKDLIPVAGLPTTAGSLRLPLEIAAEDAPVIRRLRAAGCVVIGTTSLHEWAYGTTSHNPHFGNVLNPHDPRRVAGGSSGGSAVAVAAGMCDWAVGTDTGGSIRIPASLCGVVGLKPTLGRVDTTGVLPLSPSLDTVGPLAPDVRTAAQALGLLLGTELALGDPPPLRELRLATPAGWVTGLDRETGRAWRALAPGIQPIPFVEHAVLETTALTVLDYEARQVHDANLRAFPSRYGADVRRRLERGLAIDAREYDAALVRLVALREEADAALEAYDALVLPATPCVAPPVERRGVGPRLSRFTRPFNVTGQPVAVVPAPTPGLPVGMQIVGRSHEDEAVLRCALALEHEWRDAQRGRTAQEAGT